MGCKTLSSCFSKQPPPDVRASVSITVHITHGVVLSTIHRVCATLPDALGCFHTKSHRFQAWKLTDGERVREMRTHGNSPQSPLKCRHMKCHSATYSVKGD